MNNRRDERSIWQQFKESFDDFVIGKRQITEDPIRVLGTAFTVQSVLYMFEHHQAQAQRLSSQCNPSVNMSARAVFKPIFYGYCNALTANILKTIPIAKREDIHDGFSKTVNQSEMVEACYKKHVSLFGAMGGVALLDSSFTALHKNKATANMYNMTFNYHQGKHIREKAVITAKFATVPYTPAFVKKHFNNLTAKYSEGVSIKEKSVMTFKFASIGFAPKFVKNHISALGIGSLPEIKKEFRERTVNQLPEPIYFAFNTGITIGMGMLSGILTVPFEMIYKYKMQSANTQTMKTKSWMGCMTSIWRAQGLRGFTLGWKQALIMTPFAFLAVQGYETFHKGVLYTETRINAYYHRQHLLGKHQNLQKPQQSVEAASEPKSTSQPPRP